MKKITAFCLSLLLMLPFIPQAAAFSDVTEDLLYYENTFDNGISDLVDFSNDYGSFVKNTESRIGTVALNGNNGIGVANPISWMGRSNYFKFNTPLDSGALCISFDIARTSDTTNLSNVYSAGLNLNKTTTEQFILALKKDHSIGGPSSGLTSSTVGTGITTELNKVYNFKAIIDLDNDVVYAYVDENKVGQQSVAQDFKVYDASFGITDLTGYLDNIRITKVILPEDEAPEEGGGDTPGGDITTDDDLPENVYFDLDFEDGELPYEGSSNTYGNYVPNSNTNQSQLVTFNGNVGMGSTTNTYAPEFCFVFDDALTSGIVSVSYDVAMIDDGAGSQLSTLKINSKASKSVTGVKNDDIIILIGEGILRGPNSDLSYSGDSSTDTDVELNTIYTVNAVFDLDNKKVYAYVDGKLLNSQNLNDDYTIYDAGFGIGTSVDYLDNFRISEMTDESFKLEKIVGEKDNTYIDVFFTEIPNSTSLNADNIVITDAVGKKIAIEKINSIGARGIRINLKEALDDGGYIINFKDGFVNAISNTLFDSTYSFVIGEGKFLKSVKLEDIYGNITYLSDKNVPEIEYVILEFTEGTNASSVTAITIDGMTFKPSYEENVAKLELDNVFMGDSTYNLLISDSLDKDYVVAINTSKGSIKHKNTLFYINNTLCEDLSKVKVNDKVSVITSYVKTIPGKNSFLVSASLWNGFDMNDYAFKYASFAENETKKDVTLEFSIKSIENLKIKSFTHKGYGKINPMFDMVEIK